MAIKFGSNYSLRASSGNIVTMVAKFSSVCTCGALIEPGDAMSYDTVNRKSLCYVCVKRLSEFGATNVFNVLPTTDEAATQGGMSAIDSREAKCQSLIQRFRQLRAETLATTEQRKLEMTDILKCFKTEFTSSASVHSFIAEIAKCKHRGADCRALKTKFHGVCIHCGAANEAGELALYDHHTRRIHCLYCDCLRGL